MMVGNSFGHDDERQQGCARFVCSLYGNNGEDTDRVWYKLFCRKNAQTCNLPPTKDALKYHVARANYQACISHNSLEGAAHTPSPHGHGWDVIDGHISIHWMDQQPAPKALLQCISCNCPKGHCVGGRCSCRKKLCRALMLVVALSAATIRTLVEQKTIRVIMMKTELTIWLIRMPCHFSRFLFEIHIS